MAGLTKRQKLNQYVEQFEHLARARQEIDARNLEVLRHYRRQDEQLQERARHNLSALYVPKLYTTMEVKKSKLAVALLAGRPYAVAAPRMKDPAPTDQDFIRARNMTVLLDWQLSEQVNFYKKTLQFIHSWLLYGGAGVVLGWRRTTGTRRVRDVDPMTGLLLPPEAREYVRYDGPDIQVHSPFTMYFDLNAGDDPIGDSEAVYVTQRLTIYELERLQASGYIKGLSDVEKGSVAPEAPWESELRDLRGGGETGFGGTERLTTRHEVMYRYTDERVQVIVDRRHLVKDDENPHYLGRKPVIFSANNPLIGEAIGEGDAHPIVPLQEEINAIRNRRMDNQNFTVYKMFKVRRGADIDPNDLVPAAMKMIPLDNFDDIQEMDIRDVTQSAYEEDRIVDDEIQTTSRIFKHMYGAPFSKRATATEIATLGANADEGFQIQIQLLASEFLHPTVRMLGELNQQWLAPETAISVLGTNGAARLMFPEMFQDAMLGQTISPEDIAGDFNYKITGSTVDTLADRQFKVNQMINLLAQTAQSGAVNVPNFVRKILQLSDIDGFEDLIVASPPEMPGQQPTPGAAMPQPGLAPQDPGMLRMGPTPAEMPGML